MNTNWREEFKEKFGPMLFDEEQQKQAMTTWISLYEPILTFIESIEREARADEREDMSASKMIRLGIKEALESLRGEIRTIEKQYKNPQTNFGLGIQAGLEKIQFLIEANITDLS